LSAHPYIIHPSIHPTCPGSESVIIITEKCTYKNFLFDEGKLRRIHSVIYRHRKPVHQATRRVMSFQRFWDNQLEEM
jgi:hypothetical protein